MNGAEIMKNAMDDFKDIQEYMEIAREEHAAKTYAKLKKKYLFSDWHKGKFVKYFLD